MGETAAYDKVNQAWKVTCRAVLGQEVGELAEFEDWLQEYNRVPTVAKSGHGEEIYLSTPNYCPSAKFQSFADVDFNRRYGPLSINEVKDVDSIVQAVQERAYYTGNVILGNSQLVEKSANIIDSYYIYGSNIVSDSKYVAYSALTRYGQYCFGILCTGTPSYCIHSLQLHQNSRCFDGYLIIDSQDTYYSAKIADCAECMFSFGAVGKRYLIGNLELPKDKYLRLKKKLLAEISAQLAKDKRVFSIFDLVKHAGEAPKDLHANVPSTERSGDMKPINSYFNSVTANVLGKGLGEIKPYEHFLQKHAPGISFGQSALSGKKVYIAEVVSQFSQGPEIRKRLATEEEIRKIGETPLRQKSGLESLRFDLEYLAQLLSDVAFIGFDIVLGKNINAIECAIYKNLENCYKVTDTAYARKSGCSHWPRESEYIFGGSTIFSSSFCLNAYNSKKLSRCFEVDACENSTDLYYSHNCENVHDSMFCFNVKNLRNAIGNAPLPPEKYKRIKSSLLEQLVSELEEKKDLKWDIYNIGCQK